MTLLTIAQGLALNVGLLKPDMVVASPAREWAEALQLANETGEEMARRVAWGRLTREATLTMSGALPADFDRLADGVCVTSAGATVRPLTRAEWSSLPASTGRPRYFRVDDASISLWPDGEARIVYQSRGWVDSGASQFSADTQSPLMDEAVFLKGLIARWRRQKGMPYADQEAEYESALADAARADDRRPL